LLLSVCLPALSFLYAAVTLKKQTLAAAKKQTNDAEPILMSQNPEVNELRFPVFTQKCFPPDLYVVEKLMASGWCRL
jgi:hypothetical protein